MRERIFKYKVSPKDSKVTAIKINQRLDSEEEREPRLRCTSKKCPVTLIRSNIINTFSPRCTRRFAFPAICTIMRRADHASPLQQSPPNQWQRATELIWRLAGCSRSCAWRPQRVPSSCRGWKRHASPPRSLVLVALEQSRHQTCLLREKLIQCEACGG